MYKRYKFVSLFLLTFIIFILPISANAQTLGDLKDELEELLEEAKNASSDIKQTEEEQRRTNAQINQIYTDMTNISNEIIAKTDEIAQLEEEIEEKDEEIKELMNSLQVTTGDSFYIDYIFGAQSITDFIYRYSITEQITKSNNDLINEMNDKIEENKKKMEELEQKNIDLKNKQSDLAVKLKSLSNKKENLEELEQSIEDEIKSAQDVIAMYEKAGCKESDDINVCANKLLPPGTRFYRPLYTGYITSEFSWRIHPIYGTLQSHTGIDMSNQYKTDAKIYAVSNGLVVKIYWANCGRWHVVVHHNINGVKYTSVYMHLLKPLVQEGDAVTKDTVIGMMGGELGTDTCSTGAHLHLSIANGLWYKDYWEYADFKSHLINPRQVINFPSVGTRITWYDKITRY
jgi:murein DD-endopeptidase MepM/ murein hydrolase activator NlpD